MVAFAVDIGWMGVVQNRLQVAADAAAMAAAGNLNAGAATARQKAQQIGGQNISVSQNSYVTLADGDIVFGTWNTTTNVFSAGSAPPNAVQVTARQTVPLFFARVFGLDSCSLRAQAIALANARDIAFVLDLSGSMNNDTEIWATTAINNAFNGYPTIGSDLMTDVFSDFGYGSYPGTLQHVAQGLPNAPNNDTSYTWLANTYLLNNNSVPSKYQVLRSDSNSTRKTKAYSWIIDYQLASIMPNAAPAPDSNSNLSYWTAYLDYIIKPRNSLPPNQNSFRLDGAGNPYTDAWPSLGDSSFSSYYNKLGYLTYVQFMMDYGWNKTVTGSTKVPLSRNSPYCPWRTDNNPQSPGYGLQFPPREQPTHATRLAVMAAIDQLALLNTGIAEASKDHVCVITFNTAAGCTIKYPLNTTSCDYQAAKASLRDIQAVADDASSTASENGLILARNHLDPNVNPSGPRLSAAKFLIFLSDGIPNIKSSSNTVINNWITNNPDGEWFTSGYYTYERNATLMQIAQLKAVGWKVHSVGIGLGADKTLMDRLARGAGTAIKDPNNPNGPKISPYAEGNPADYQSRLTSIFSTIVGAPNVRLVK
jgi:hypothetical protein